LQEVAPLLVGGVDCRAGAAATGSGGEVSGVAWVLMIPALLPRPVKGGNTYCTALDRGAKAMAEITGNGASACTAPACHAQFIYSPALDAFASVMEVITALIGRADVLRVCVAQAQ
jgi:hypothetical protein